MASVSAVISVIDSNLTSRLYEIVSMKVTCISVTISILYRAKDFALIYPHAGCKIRMRNIYSFIKDSNNDFRATCTLSPCTFCTDICTSSKLCNFSLIKKTLKRTIIVKIPLESIKRISSSCLGSCKLTYHLSSKRHCLLLRCSLKRTVVSDTTYLTKFRKVCSHLINWSILRKTHYIPKMKSSLTSLVLCAWIYRKDSLNLISINKGKDFINTEHT